MHLKTVLQQKIACDCLFSKISKRNCFPSSLRASSFRIVELVFLVENESSRSAKSRIHFERLSRCWTDLPGKPENDSNWPNSFRGCFKRPPDRRQTVRPQHRSAIEKKQHGHSFLPGESQGKHRGSKKIRMRHRARSNPVLFVRRSNSDRQSDGCNRLL